MGHEIPYRAQEKLISDLLFALQALREQYRNESRPIVEVAKPAHEGGAGVGD
jgi:hypothetical protein